LRARNKGQGNKFLHPASHPFSADRYFLSRMLVVSVVLVSLVRQVQALGVWGTSLR
jgi:hypothetical protein